MSEILEGFITRRELAAQLNKSLSTLERWARLQIGPPVTPLGREPYYSVESVRKWLASREEPQPRRVRNDRSGAVA